MKSGENRNEPTWLCGKQFDTVGRHQSSEKDQEEIRAVRPDMVRAVY